jgi:hypothetical protein
VAARRPLFTRRLHRQGQGFSRSQIGLLSLDGKLLPITRDTNAYSTLTLSTDGKNASSVQVKTTRTLTLLRSEDLNKPDSSPTLPQAANPQMVQWSPDGKLLVADGEKITRMDSDGQNPAVLVSDPSAGILGFSPCGDRHLLLTWAYHQNNVIVIWRTMPMAPLPCNSLRNTSKPIPSAHPMDVGCTSSTVPRVTSCASPSMAASPRSFPALPSLTPSATPA